MSLKKERIKQILVLALPIIGGMLSQNVLNLVDTAMVGTMGNAALAAVGLGGFAVFFGQSILLGVSTGVQAFVARRVGEGKENESAYPLNTGLLVVLIGGLILTTILYFLVPILYPYLNSSPEVIEVGVPYLEVRVLGSIFVAMNFSFRGYWNGIKQSKVYLSTLVVMHVCNIFLNYVLIFGKFGFPELGTLGAGIGTSVSTGIGTLVYICHGLSKARQNGFLKSLPSWKEVKELVKISLPNSIQQLFFSGGFTALYWIIGKVGTVELAAANILVNIMLIVILPGLGLGLAAATLVGQAMGRNDIPDAKEWGWDVGKVGFLLVAVMTIPMWVFPDPIISIFVKDQATIDVARLPLRFTAFAMPFDVFGLIVMNSLFGAGDTKRVMKVAIILQWIIFLPLAYLIGPVFRLGLFYIWALQGLYRALQAGIFSYFWRQGKWASIKL